MTAFNLGEYSKRIGCFGTARPDLATLTALHRAHVAAIPFENLDIQMGCRVKLDPDALQAKMVRQRRGGYCFEQNSLFMLALESIGFAPEPREARVRQNAGGLIRPRTHMVLTMPCEGREWLADVGFGGDGLLEPIALDGNSTAQAGVVYRVASEGSLRVLQRHIVEGWEDLYAHNARPRPCNRLRGRKLVHEYTPAESVRAQPHGATHGQRHATHPAEPDVLDCAGQRRQVREITRQEVVPLLRDTFGLEVPEDARFRALDSKSDWRD